MSQPQVHICLICSWIYFHYLEGRIPATFLLSDAAGSDSQSSVTFMPVLYAFFLLKPKDMHLLVSMER